MTHALDVLPRRRCRPAIAARLLVTLAAALLAFSCATAPKPMPLDLKITNGRIVDGTGAPWFRGDVGVRGNTIVAMGNLEHLDARTTLDAAGEVVAPGFIDLLGQDSDIPDPHLEAKVRQGITTELTGEGYSPAPSKEFATVRDYLDYVDRHGSAINIASMIGASNARHIVIGDVNRAATADELRAMEAIIEAAMREGAIGLSTSLIYVPAMYSTTEELVSLASVAARYDGVYFTHMRDEGDRIDMGLDEAFRIGREAKIPVNIWHLKAAGPANWGRMPHVIERIRAAREEGIDVAANVYPYTASGTSLSTLAADWALEGGYAAFQQRLADPEQRARIAEALRAAVAKRGDRYIYVTRIPNLSLAQYGKKYLEQIAEEMGVPREEALIRLFAESKSSPGVIYFSMNEDDLRHALSQWFVSAGSDASSPPPQARIENSAWHPRAYGTFGRVLGTYVRDAKLYTLEEGVRKVTSQAAARMHLDGRGILRPGTKADIVVFDPARIRDTSTYEDPHHFTEGVRTVVVNGVPVLRDGVMTGALPGRAIRGRGASDASATQKTRKQ